jgi:hypothetical protein
MNTSCVHHPSWPRGRCQSDFRDGVILGVSDAVLDALGDQARIMLTAPEVPPEAEMVPCKGEVP